MDALLAPLLAALPAPPAPLGSTSRRHAPDVMPTTNKSAPAIAARILHLAIPS